MFIEKTAPNSHIFKKQSNIKRARTLKACLSCRKKKTKCDGIKPVCGSCAKRGVLDGCHYEEPQWTVNVLDNDSFQSANENSLHEIGNKVTDTQVSSKARDVNNKVMEDPKLELLEVMNNRIKQLEDALLVQNSQTNEPFRDNTNNQVSLLGPLGTQRPNNNASINKIELINEDYVDFHNNNFISPIKATQGALSWVSLLKKDVYLNSIIVSSQKARSYITKLKPESEIANEEFMFKLNNENSNSETRKAFDDANGYPPHTVTSHLHFDQKDDFKLPFMVQVREALKDFRLIWLLIDKFFDSELFFQISFFDKTDFTSRVVDIIGFRGDTQLHLNIRKRIDLTIIGTLLLIMRISSLSSYNFGKNDHQNLSKSEKYIIDHPISRSVLPIIQRCYDEVITFREPRLDVFQFLSLRVVYDFFAPEDCDCITFADASKIGQLLYYATQCSLNRDPTSCIDASTTIPGATNFNKNKNLLRRLWYQIVFLDSHQELSIGCVPVIDKHKFDTHLPHIDESESELEYNINVWFHEKKTFLELCQPLLDEILDVRKRSTLTTVSTLLYPIVEHIKGIKTLKEIMEFPHETVIQRCFKLKHLSYFLDCHSLVYIIYYHLFLFFNSKKDRAHSLVYFLKMIKTSTTLYENIHFLQSENPDYDLRKHFGTGLIIYPKIEYAIHRIGQLMFAILARIKGLKAFKVDGLKPDSVEIVDKIVDVSNNTLGSIISSFVSISDTYYHPWLVSKRHAFISSKVLTVPKGNVSSSNKTPIDIEFIKTLNGIRFHDEMFDLYSADDFKDIHDELIQFEIIRAKGLRTPKLSEHFDPKNEGLKRTLPLVSTYLNPSVITGNDRLWFQQTLGQQRALTNPQDEIGDKFSGEHTGNNIDNNRMINRDNNANRNNNAQEFKTTSSSSIPMNNSFPTAGIQSNTLSHQVDQSFLDDLNLASLDGLINGHTGMLQLDELVSQRGDIYSFI